MSEKKHWIKKATEGSHGQFRAKAEHAGKSTLAYAHEHDRGSSKTAKQARLAEKLISISHNHHKKMAGHSKIMHSMYGEG